MSEQVKVAVLPDCDLCKYVEALAPLPHKAVYDGKTVHGPWGNMCEAAFQKWGIGLGTGRGQRLVLREATTTEG